MPLISPLTSTLPRQSVLRRLLLRRVLTLPFAVLRFLSGGGVVHIDGRTLDTQITFLWKAFFARQDHRTPLSLTGTSVEGAREDWRDAAALMNPGPDIRVKIEEVGDGTSISGQLVRPAQIDHDAPLLVFFHDGGGVLGGTELGLAFASLLAQEARCPVFLPRLRPAPENRFPAGYEDAQAAWTWAQDHLAQMGATSGLTAVGGAGLGGGMAARLCLDLLAENKPLPVAQLLVSPLLDLSDTGLKTSPFAQSWPLSAADLGIIIGHYAGAGTALSDPVLSPLCAELPAGLPPALITAGGIDPLSPQAERFARKLMERKTRVVYRLYDTLPIGFGLFAGVADHAAQAVQDIAALWAALWRDLSTKTDAEG
ncbi:MAG: alpha/beta hydrolase [Asticcacaulis sp.]